MILICDPDSDLLTKLSLFSIDTDPTSSCINRVLGTGGATTAAGAGGAALTTAATEETTLVITAGGTVATASGAATTSIFPSPPKISKTSLSMSSSRALASSSFSTSISKLGSCRIADQRLQTSDLFVSNLN